MNLQRGKTVWPQPPIIFHFNPRFKEAHIIRNALLKGSWGAEEKSSGCPFRPGRDFHMAIRCESKQFTVAIDGVGFTTFKYRHPVEDVDTIVVQGDVKISDIYIR